MANVIFEPIPKQEELLVSNADICMMAGGAGSGKSEILLWDILGLQFTPFRISDPLYRALIYRKQSKHLSELLDRSKRIFPAVDPGAVFRSWQGQNTWTFSSGAQISLQYFEKFEQVESMQGKEFDYIGCDELGQYEDERVFMYMWSRLRSKTGQKCYLRATSNPSRHKWLRKFFRIDDIGTSTDFKLEFETSGGKRYVQVKYIQARLLDNPYRDPAYEEKLMMMPEDERNALLFGYWNAYDSEDGLIYLKEMNKLREDKRISRIPYDSALDLDIYSDIGRDTTTMLFVQRFGHEIRVINSYHNASIDMSHYCEVLKDMVKKKGYKINRWILPHDGINKHVNSEYSTEQVVQKYCPDIKVMSWPKEKNLPREQGISNCLRLFKHLQIDSTCEWLIESLEKYGREHNKRLGTWGEPKHDIYSHMADTLRYVMQDEAPKQIKFDSRALLANSMLCSL